MSRGKRASLVFAALIILVPFAYNFFAPTNPVHSIADDYSPYDALLSPMLWVYAIPVVLICMYLIVRSSAMSTPTKIIYVVFTWLIFPVAALVLIYRLYWYRPLDVPKTVEEQREILRANVRKLKSGER